MIGLQLVANEMCYLGPPLWAFPHLHRSWEYVSKVLETTSLGRLYLGSIENKVLYRLVVEDMLILAVHNSSVFNAIGKHAFSETGYLNTSMLRLKHCY